MKRFVRKNRVVYASSHCRLCGSCHGVVAPEIEHRGTTCMLCGTRQCMGNGLGNGCCAICFYGFLPGWSGIGGNCGYKNCRKPAVARGIRGKRGVCAEHFALQHGSDYLQKRLDSRNKEWIEVEDSPRSPYI